MAEGLDLLRVGGAAFPWRTITGPECSGHWPAGTAAFHVNADIAVAAVRYTDATGGEEFAPKIRGWTCWSTPPGCGVPSGTTTSKARSASTASPARTIQRLADNNIYTNLMAQRNLLAAADAAERYPDTPASSASRPRSAAAGAPRPRRCTIPYDEPRRARHRQRGSPAPGLGLRAHRAASSTR